MAKAPFLLFILCILKFSTPSAAEMLGDRIVWQCNAYDETGQIFVALGQKDWAALASAKALCKKESLKPKTCEVSKENCDATINGSSVSPLWQCKALDSLANLWVGGVYRVADNAVFSAKNRCHSFSAVPTTCYVYLFTCKNLNPILQY